MSSADVDVALRGEGVAVPEALLALPESQWYERKSGRVSARDLAIPLVAMANADGGVIVTGLHDKAVDGVAPARMNQLRQAALDHTVPPVRARVSEIAVPGPQGEATLLVYRVEPGDHVHTLTNGQCFLRVGDESRKLTLAQQQELSFDRGGAPYDSTPVDLTVADLDSTQLTAYTQVIGADSVEGMLAARDLVDRRGRLTVAAALLFDARPQREFPSAVVRILRYGRDERGTGATMTLEDDADLRIEGSLPRQITTAAAKIDELIPKWRQLSPNGRFEPIPRIPRDAWLEGLVNAVVHRSYSMMGDHIRVEIFPNRLEISSPGRFPGLVDTAKPLQISRYARNPRIARVCADLGIARELGEGIKRMFAEMRRRGLVDPIYTQTAGSVRLALMASDAVPDDVLQRLTPSARGILDALRLADEPLGTGQLIDLVGVTRMTATRALASLMEEGLVEWTGTSKKDPRAVWRLR